MSAPYARLPAWADYGLIPLINLVVAFLVATLDHMQETVESLGPGDSVYIANWLFWPTDVPLTLRSRNDAADLRGSGCSSVVVDAT